MLIGLVFQAENDQIQRAFQALADVTVLLKTDGTTVTHPNRSNFRRVLIFQIIRRERAIPESRVVIDLRKMLIILEEKPGHRVFGLCLSPDCSFGHTTTFFQEKYTIKRR